MCLVNIFRFFFKPKTKMHFGNHYHFLKNKNIFQFFLQEKKK